MLQIMPASVPNFCDATSPSTLESDPDADIVVAGFPCQTFSGEGKGVGLDDPRGMVVFSIILYVARRLPKVIIFENVADLLNTHSNCLIKIIEAIRAIKDPATGSRAYWVSCANQRAWRTPSKPAASVDRRDPGVWRCQGILRVAITVANDAIAGHHAAAQPDGDQLQ